MKNKLLFSIPGTFLFFSFCLCYFYMAYYNRFASDDYYMLKIVDEKGVLEAVKFFYLNWEGAYSGITYNFTLVKIMSCFATPFLANLFCVALIFISFYFIFHVVLKKLLSTYDKRISLLLATVSVSSLYYNDLAISEVWYWMIGGVYLVFPVLFFLNLVVFFSSEKKYVINLCYFFFFIFGSVRLNYSLIALTLFFICLVGYFIRYKKIHKKTIFAFVLLSLALVTYIIAPGNYIRHGEFAGKISFAIPDIISNVFTMAVEYVKEYVILKMPYHILFMLPVIYIGYLLKESILKLVDTRKKALTWILILTGVLFSLLLAQCLVMYLAKGGQTKRTLPMNNMFFVLYFIAMFGIIGAFFANRTVSYVVFSIGILFGSALLLRRFQINKPIVVEFSKAVDQRMATIENAVNNYSKQPIDTLYLPKLPPSGWLHAGEIVRYADGDPMNNGFLMYYFESKFVIDLEK